ncbi:MAG: hypothetical protein A4E32_02105 [Methanomassiliicoccales archaeon PtaU1.Bin124]|nr:MAG: hypothetical protein A4E32_02105 [Methanomassiliicoccales archaeon PtaU1.Bin124]
MFLFGLFLTIGFSPQSLIFQFAVDQITPFITYAAIIVLIVLLYFVYDSIYSPLRDLNQGLKANGTIGLIALVMATVGGIYALVNVGGIILLIMAVVFWKVSLRFR